MIDLIIVIVIIIILVIIIIIIIMVSDDLDSMVPDDARLRLRQCSFCARFQRVSKRAFQKCGRCLSVRYCGSDCQRGH